VAARRSQAASVFRVEPGAASFVEELGTVLGCEEVILTGSGWNANVGLVAALASDGTPVYADRLAHASMLDGARMAGAAVRTFRHHDLEALRELIVTHGPGVVCVDAVYSTDGSILDLRAAVEVCADTGSVLVLDEAHSVGSLGPQGGGLAVREGLHERVLFRTGSLSKALSGPGGFIATTRNAARAVRAGFRPGIFSSAPSPILTAGHRAALRIAIREPQRANRARGLGRQFRDLLTGAGLAVSPSETHLVSLRFHGAAACRVHQRLCAAGVGTCVFVHPATARNESLVRFALHCELADEDIGYVARVAATTAAKLREVAA
jgi:CAI-1 autoinducer synthase